MTSPKLSAARSTRIQYHFRTLANRFQASAPRYMLWMTISMVIVIQPTDIPFFLSDRTAPRVSTCHASSLSIGLPLQDSGWGLRSLDFNTSPSQLDMRFPPGHPCTSGVPFHCLELVYMLREPRLSCPFIPMHSRLSEPPIEEPDHLALVNTGELRLPSLLTVVHPSLPHLENAGCSLLFGGPLYGATLLSISSPSS